MKTKIYTPKDFYWAKWTAKDIKPLAKTAVLELKKDYEAIKRIPKEKRTFENTVEAIERAGRDSAQKISCAHLLAEVSPEKKVRDAAHKMSEEYSRVIVDIEYDDGIYQALKDYVSKKEKLSGERKKLLDDMILGYKRLGFGLEKRKRNIFKNNLKRLSKISLQFHKNINDYKDHITLTEEEAVGLPENYLKGLKKDLRGRYLVSLEYPDLNPFLENSPNDKKRKELTDKFNRMGGVKNLALLKEIVSLKQLNAKMLGYKSAAHYITEDRMAKNPKTVMRFINSMYGKIKAPAKKELAELAAFKRKFTGNKKAKFEYYDGYYLNELKKQKFNIDNEKIREYFPFEKVREGMFEIYQKLLGVKYRRIHRYPVWHKDVEVYAVLDKGKVISYFTLDLFPREGKFGHAMMVPTIFGYKTRNTNGAEEYIAPLACLVANFPKPRLGHPSLLNHEEVETLFHEFGHTMHHVLNRTSYASQASAHVAWDFVETPSQLLENWLWNKDMLKIVSGHYETKKKLPNKILNDMLRAKNFMIGRFYIRQLFLTIFDMTLHLGRTKKKPEVLYRILIERFTGIPTSADNIRPAGFGHLVGAYSAGYYGYMWSKVFAADMFTRFWKEGLLNPKTGGDYRREILEVGGSREEIDSVKRFLRRAPNNKAFLKEIGL